MFGYFVMKRLLDALAFGNHFIRKSQHLPQHELDPLTV